MVNNIQVWEPHMNEWLVGEDEIKDVHSGNVLVWDRNNARLPKWFQEVEYIESNWAWNSSWQYIDTWYIPNSNTEIELSLSNYTNTPWSYQLFWEDTNWATWDWWVSVVTDNYSWNWPNASTFTHWFRDWNAHLLLLNNTWLYRDWILVHSWRAWQTFTATYTMAVFCLHRTNTYIERSSYRLHYMKIRDNWILVMDFVPCYRKSDWEIWLYDLVNKQFYTNAWTWVFTKWPNI